MNLLILGGNGYLGSKVLRSLHAQGKHHLVCTVRSGADLSRLNGLDLHSSIRCIPSTPEAVCAAMEYVSFDAVLNMVCSYGRKGMLYPNVLEANMDFPLRVLNSAADRGVRRFITIGTALPDELNMYSFSKKMFSEFGRYYADHYGVNFSNLKLEMFYGADEPRNRFLPGLIHRMVEGRSVDVSLGTQRRDIIAIEDIVRAVELVVDAKLDGYQELSVGTGIAPTIRELVEYIWQETGCKSHICWGAFPMRENEPDCIGNPEWLRSISGGVWEPVFWKDGIHNMIERIAEEKKRDEATD